MKNRLVATIITIVLLIGAIGMSFSYKGVTAQTPTYYWLTILTSPPGLHTWPTPPEGNHTAGTYVNVTAPAMISLGPDSRAIFTSWTGGSSAGPYSVWAHMNMNRTVTANYKIQHKLKVESLYKTVYIHNGSWYQTNESWIDENTVALAGVASVSSSPPGFYLDPGFNNQWAYLVNWTGDATGKHLSGVLPADGYYSDPINMTGPKTAVALWAYMYKLYVLPGTLPPMTNPPGGSAGWYYESTLVNMTAPDPHPTWINPNARWLFDYWELDGVKQTPPNVNLTVHMDTNHTATLFYKRQTKVTLADNIGNQSGIADTGSWYWTNENYTFSAPPYVYLSGVIRYEFRFWEHVGSGSVGTANPITLNITTAYDGSTLKARYQTQYYLGLSSSGSTVPGYLYPDSDTTGWYDAGSTINLKAKPVVNIDSVTRYSFVQWKNHLGGTNVNNNITFAMMQPWNVTAEYDLEYLAQWDYSPASITIPGWPGQAWIKNGTVISYTAPATDASGDFVFYYWEIDAVVYPAGDNPIPLGVMTGPVYGTAFYANKTKIFMDPSYHEETAHAYCTTFDVTVFATNFDANREVSGKPMDIYGFEIGIMWNTTLLELVDVSLNLPDFFAPNDYMVAFEEIDNSAGTYLLAASVKGNFTGFEGTKAIFTMTFHVIYDPCYPNVEQCWIKFDPAHRKLVNHENSAISPELGWKNCKYKIKTTKPMLEVRDAADGDNYIQVDTYSPGQTFFDVEVWLLNGVKVHDFFVEVHFDASLIHADSVVIADYLKPPYTVYSWVTNNGAGWVRVRVVQDPSVPLQNCTGLLFTIKFEVVHAIFYTIPGPHHLTCDITIDSTSYLSVKCPTPFNQVVSAGDLGTIKATYVFNPLPGDLDLDGCVTVLDLQLIADNYLKIPVAYDITGNGKTDIFDFVFVALRFGTCI
jgi:hypothetical protein